ncbi:MAG: hypothetical protein ACHP7P_02455 [Terriglobales bacterium]
MSDHTDSKRPWVGQPLRRKEERRLVTGRGKFVDDFKPDRCLHMWLVRSPYAHARIDRVDVTAAQALPGVVATLTGDEIAKLCQPFFPIGPDPCTKIIDLPMAHKKARYQGEPVVAIAAESARIAEDAAELVEVDYTPLEPVLDAESGAASQSLVHEGCGDQPYLAGRLGIRRRGEGLPRSRARGSHRPPALPPLLLDAARE